MSQHPDKEAQQPAKVRPLSTTLHAQRMSWKQLVQQPQIPGRGSSLLDPPASFSTMPAAPFLSVEGSTPGGNTDQLSPLSTTSATQADDPLARSAASADTRRSYSVSASQVAKVSSAVSRADALICAEWAERSSPLRRACALLSYSPPALSGVALTKSQIDSMLVAYLQHVGLVEVAASLQKEAGLQNVDAVNSPFQIVKLIQMVVRQTEFLWETGLDDFSGNQGEGKDATAIEKKIDEVVEHAREQLGIIDPDDSQDMNVWDEPEDGPENLVRLEKEDPNSGPSNIKAATVNKLIERLTPMDLNDFMFMKTFLMTYQTFMTPQQLLTKLIQRYQVPPEKHLTPENIIKIKTRVINVMKNWIEDYYDTFDDKLKIAVNSFIEELKKENKKLSMQLSTAIMKKNTFIKRKTEIIFSELPPEVKINPRILFSDTFSLLDLPEEELARQLTLIESNMFRSIQSPELLNLAWSKPKYKDRAKNLLHMISRFNVLSSWVVESIVSQPRLRDRARIMGKFITIAEILLELRNFSSLQGILSGFSNAAIHRLKFTKEDLPARLLQSLESMCAIMDSKKNYQSYRDRLRTTPSPKVPYVGVYLTDLTFIEDGNKDFVEIGGGKKLINFSKRLKIFSVISDIQRDQAAPYNLLPILQIQKKINELDICDQKQAYSKSLECEPRNTTRDQLL